MNKFKVGDKVRAFGDLNQTEEYFTTVFEMRRLRYNKTIMTVEISRDYTNVQANGYLWHSDDLELVGQKDFTKGLAYQIKLQEELSQ